MSRRKRNFILADGIKVDGASMENGLLYIDLLQPVSHDESKKIEIADASTKSKKKLISLKLNENSGEET